ncbi:MAG TPA: hypothetical protein PKM88_07355 [bacterium]|nr:hypothetical protein [bacterium]
MARVIAVTVVVMRRGPAIARNGRRDPPDIAAAIIATLVIARLPASAIRLVAMSIALRQLTTGAVAVTIALIHCLPLLPAVTLRIAIYHPVLLPAAAAIAIAYCPPLRLLVAAIVRRAHPVLTLMPLGRTLSAWLRLFATMHHRRTAVFMPSVIVAAPRRNRHRRACTGRLLFVPDMRRYPARRFRTRLPACTCSSRRHQRRIGDRRRARHALRNCHVAAAGRIGALFLAAHRHCNVHRFGCAGNLAIIHSHFFPVIRECRHRHRPCHTDCYCCDHPLFHLSPPRGRSVLLV